MDIHRLLRVRAKSPEDVLGMILSNRIDMGHSSGGLISAAQFPILIQDILAWQAATAAKAGAAGAAGDVPST